MFLFKQENVCDMGREQFPFELLFESNVYNIFQVIHTL